MEPTFKPDAENSIPRAMPVEQVFPAKKSIVGGALLFLIPGMIVIVGALVMTVVIAKRIPATPDDNFAPGLNSGFFALIIPPIFGGFLILRGLSLLRMTSRVVLDREGVHVYRIGSRRVVPWCDIEAVDRGTSEELGFGPSTPTIEILDVAGRKLAKVTDSVERFEELADALIAGSSAATGRTTHVPEQTEDRRIAKETKKIRWTAWAFVFFTLAMAAGFVWGVYEESHLRRYATEGVKVEAKVLRTWMVSVTPYVEYEFQDNEGNRISREAMMYQDEHWDHAQESPTITVEYLPSAPSWNRIVSGENQGAQFSGKFLFVTGFGILFFGGMAVFTLMGYDLKAEQGVSQLVRHGRVVKEWGVNAKRPSKEE
ncbi:MAG: hypothetical protein DHS20C16_29460 [Phycisphaerae bacterium]|nr:MAG: hypothetical protein DHS20C16_29460 [Phycisphaerae bacterium]